MSMYGLSARGRAMSHASIRKRLLRSTSQQRKQISKQTTTESFRPKLERLLQQNKIEYIMNTDPHTKANLFYTTHINEMQKQLSSSKKSLSTMVMKTKSKEYNINRLKNEIAKIQREQALLRDDSNLNKNKLGDIKSKFEKKKEDLEEKIWVDKSYTYLRSRLDKDEEFLKTRHANLDRTVKQLQQQKRILQNNLSELTQLNEKLAYNLSQARNISKEQTDQKNQFIQLLNEEMAEKDMINDLKIEKVNREDEIKDLMPSVIQKEQLQKYMHILFTNKLLGQIIKKKSEKLIEKYRVVQNAYLHIKSNTNIVQLSKVLSRMQNQDQQYQNLLKKVASLQSQLQQLEKSHRQSIQRQHNILSLDKSEQTKKMQENKYQGIQKDAYDILVREKDKLTDRKNNDHILKKKIMLWISEHAAMFEINSKVKNQEQFFNQVKMLQASIKRKLGIKDNDKKDDGAKNNQNDGNKA